MLHGPCNNHRKFGTAIRWYKFLVAERCKSCEIYSGMYNIYGEACFSQKCLQKA